MSAIIVFLFFSYLSITGKGLVSSECRFPDNYRGNYFSRNPNIEVTIEDDEIKPWGKCHSKNFDWFILAERNQNKSCLKCLQLILRSPLIIEVLAEELSSCHSEENIFCPNVIAMPSKKYFLYRQETLQVYHHSEILCPFRGKFRISYSADGGKRRCYSFISELINCPISDTFHIKYKNCSFPEKELRFQCLGDWDAFENQRYIILKKKYERSEMKLLCGLYRRDIQNENIYLALSSDDRCGMLYSSIIGQETMILHPVQISNKFVKNFSCSFPEWSLGQWEDLIVERNIINYGGNEKINFHTSHCIRMENPFYANRYLIHSIDKCDKETYGCIWLVNRTMNIIEFQLGKRFGSINDTSSVLCSNDQFNNKSWFTKLRSDMNETSHFPIMGEYFGILPFQDDLCLRIMTDCIKPDLLAQKTVKCHDINEVLEVNHYLCYGNWIDGTIVYSYAFHLESKEMRCFAGKIDENMVKIVEIGENCIRQQIPLQKAMDLIKIGSCLSDNMKSENISISSGSSVPASTMNTMAVNSSPTIAGFLYCLFALLHAARELKCPLDRIGLCILF
ncbi:uncharacterized protein LOC111628466 isoform X2 [Centruroides sculpturatus]|uniref:uncharacterized protein LOC111628466 isoform X2 n=1 Tax=Centruroides sculpturatus TaxID=218467 RepID=UPI000C6EC138|nr:uncharacterized protein LOC111628466 isoform X2 [Centruroides sculpturatus]